MILTGHQPTYLPWLGLFNKISNSNCFILFDNVQYLPKEWMNRNKIKTPNGEIFLNVPVLKKSFLKKKIYEIKINNNLDWKRKHLKSIKLNYAKAEFYTDYIDYFEEIYSQDWVYLLDLIPSQMIEYGEILPESGEEKSWFKSLSKSLQRKLKKIDK